MEASLGYLLTLLGVASADAIAIVLTNRLISMYLVLIYGFIFSKILKTSAVEDLNDIHYHTPLQ